jgi:hypothetical protein
MKRFGLGLLLSPLALLCAFGQQTDWDKVAALPAGTKIQLVMRDYQSLEGALSQVSAEGLTLTRKKDSLQVARSDVRRLWIFGKGSRANKVVLAALIGFGAACPFGWAFGAEGGGTTKIGYCAAFGSVAGAVAGGIAGATPGRRRTLVYRAP